jgi:hypothetical protein
MRYIESENFPWNTGGVPPYTPIFIDEHQNY